MIQAARVLLTAFTTFAFVNSAVFAQDDSNPENASAAVEKSAGELDTWDRLIYVPFRELQKVFDSQKASAVIPYAEYLELLEAYLDANKAADTAPDAVITESQFVGTVEKDIVRINSTFQIRVLRRQGWARLPLDFGNAAVGKVSAADDASVILRGVGKGSYELLLDGEGDYTVTLQLLATVKTSPESRSFSLHCPVVGISELTLTIPDADQTVQVTPLQVLLPSDGSNAKQTVIKASLGATGQFSVHWNPRAGSKPVMDLLTSVTNRTDARIEPGLIQTTATFDYEVLRGELTEVTVITPPDARIIDVVSSNGRIRNWTPEKSGETHQVIKVELLTPVTDRFQLTVQTERTPQGDTYQLLGRTEGGTVQGVHAEGVVRESGQLNLTSDSSLTTLVQSQSGVKRIEIGGGKGNAAVAQAWEFSGTTGTLVVQTRPVEPRLLVAQSTRLVFDDDELRLSTRLTYTVERAGVFQLDLSYPDTLTIDKVQADGMSEFNVDKDAGKLTLSLTQKRLGKINVDITAHQPFDAAAEGAETQLPTITPADVEREDGLVSVYAPRFLDVVTVDEKTTGLFPADGVADGNVGRAVRVASWKYTQRPFTLAVRTTPRPAQLAASVATTATIEPKRMDVDSVLRFDIRNAGLDTFRVAVPEDLADKVSFTAKDARHKIQQSSRSSEVQDGWVTWTLVLQEEVTGIVEFNASWITSLPELVDATDEQEVVLEPLRIQTPFTDAQADKRKVTLSATNGEIRLLRHDSLSITAEGSGDTMEQIDVRELRLVSQDGYLAFRYFSQPASATIRIQKHEIHEVVATVVSRAAVEIVTDKQKLASYRCRFRVKSSERQRLRIDLPVGADLQSPLIDNRRTTFETADVEAVDFNVSDGWDAYFVNISRDGTSDESFLLTFQFRCPITDAESLPYNRQGGKQILRLPLVGADGGGTVVQETRVAVWAPDDISFVGEPTHWSLAGRHYWSVWNPMRSPTAAAEAESLNDWIGGTSGGGDFARQGNVTVYRALGRQPQINVVWWHRPFLVSVISGALLFIGFILRHTSWENRLTLTIAGCLAVALWSLNDASEAMQFLSAGSLALIAVAGIWLVAWLTGQRTDDGHGPRMPQEPTAPPDPPASQDDGPKSPATTPVSAASGASAPVAAPQTLPATVSPSPGVVAWMDDIMGGK